MNFIYHEDKLENMPAREKMHNKTRYPRHKSFYRHFRRFLEANVGKPVDTVFSDFMNADWVPETERSYDTFSNTVETVTFKRGNDIFYHPKYGIYGERNVADNRSWWYPLFWVHPQTRTLQITKGTAKYNYRKQRQQELAQKVRILGDYHQYLKVDGIWYEVKGFRRPVPQANTRYSYMEIGPRDIMIGDKYDFYITISMKRQLSSKELKALSLKNDLPIIKKCAVCGGSNCRIFSHKHKNHE